MPKLKHKKGKVVFEKYESAYRTHLVQESILEKAPEIEFDPSKPQDYMPNEDNYEKYESYGLAYFDSYAEFREAMQTRYAIEATDVYGVYKTEKIATDKGYFKEVKNLVPLRYGQTSDIMIKSAFTEQMEPRIVRFWEEYLRRDEMITNDTYLRERNKVFKQNVLDAIGNAEIILAKGGEYKGSLSKVRSFLDSLSDAELHRLASERSAENDTRSRVFYLDIFYIGEGKEADVERDVVEDFFDKVRSIFPEKTDTIERLLAGETIPTRVDAHETLTREFRDKYNVDYDYVNTMAKKIKEKAIYNAEHAIRKSMIRTKKSGEKYVLFKPRNVSQAIIDILYNDNE